MSFYRLFVSAIAAMVITAPVFADDTASVGTSSDQTQAAQPATAGDTQAANGQQGSAEQTQVNINTASVSDLVRVKGVTGTKARAIVAYRKKHGDFKTVNDLAKVKGFTHMKSDEMKAMFAQFTV